MDGNVDDKIDLICAVAACFSPYSVEQHKVSAGAYGQEFSDSLNDREAYDMEERHFAATSLILLSKQGKGI